MSCRGRPPYDWSTSAGDGEAVCEAVGPALENTPRRPNGTLSSAPDSVLVLSFTHHDEGAVSHGGPPPPPLLPPPLILTLV